MAAPNNPRFVTVVMDLGLTIEPQLAPGPEGPIQSADRSTATVGGVDQSFSEDLVRSGSLMFCDRNEKEDDGECQRRSLAADEGAAEKAEPTPLRNEAPLNCVSLRSRLDCEVTCGAVTGQDERPFRAPLTAPQVTPELDAARKKTSKVSREDRQNGGCCGSTELPVVAPERS